jgi:hypothetical protein
MIQNVQIQCLIEVLDHPIILYAAPIPTFLRWLHIKNFHFHPESNA